MASSGPNYPTLANQNSVTPEDDNSWSDVTNVYADDGNYASITSPTFDTGDISYRLRAFDLDFAIPTGATIDGVIVEIERYCDIGAAVDYRVQLRDNVGNLIGDNKADTGTSWPATPGIATYGGAADDWNAGLDVTIVNSVNFGVVLSCEATDDNADVYIDYARATIYYTEVAGPGQPTAIRTWGVPSGSGYNSGAGKWN